MLQSTRGPRVYYMFTYTPSTVGRLHVEAGRVEGADRRSYWIVTYDSVLHVFSDVAIACARILFGKVSCKAARRMKKQAMTHLCTVNSGCKVFNQL